MADDHDRKIGSDIIGVDVAIWRTTDAAFGGRLQISFEDRTTATAGAAARQATFDGAWKADGLLQL